MDHLQDLVLEETKKILYKKFLSSNEISLDRTESNSKNCIAIIKIVNVGLKISLLLQ